MTVHLLLSIITGTAAMSVFAGDEPQILGHRRLAVEQALVHVDVDDVRAALDLLAGDFDGLFVLLLLDQPGEFREPVTFVRSPIIRKLLSGRSASGCVPLSRSSGATVGRHVRLAHLAIRSAMAAM